MIVNFCPEWMEHRKRVPEEVVKVIEEFVIKVVEKYPDAEVYLFGSYARGDWLEDSDIDLIVVSNHFKNIDWVERLGKLRLLAAFKYAFEILAYTREELKMKLQSLNIIKEASKYWIRINC